MTDARDPIVLDKEGNVIAGPAHEGRAHAYAMTFALTGWPARIAFIAAIPVLMFFGVFAVGIAITAFLIGSIAARLFR